MQKQRKIEQWHDSAPAGQPPPPTSLSLSGLLLSPHIITAALALLLLMLLIHTLQFTPPLQFCWVWLISPLPYKRKVIPPSPEWWWTEGRGLKAEESIWLVNFNAEADVSLCTCEISAQEMCHGMILQGSICSLYCRVEGGLWPWPMCDTCGLQGGWKGI